jgi:2-polyprenyl-3-methyl-5-hydroxy-6-metoxy-1,4-benzoquinol methylase
MHFIGSRIGRLDTRQYTYFSCDACHFSCISNPRMDYENIYSEEYYQGRGADPTIDYLYELENSELTIRNYEWKGIVSIFNKLVPQGGRWLDFGCGAGGLVAFAKQHETDIVGFDEGWGAQAGRLKNIPILMADELKAAQGKYDFITAIEVIEHAPDPLAMLKLIRSLLKPGGVLFLTTGNAKPWRGKLLNWSYAAAVPEVHISFFEPATLSLALEKAGFQAQEGRFFNGFVNIIKFKILKTLHFRQKNFLLEYLPWHLISKLVDLRYQASKQPYGIAT